MINDSFFDQKLAAIEALKLNEGNKIFSFVSNKSKTSMAGCVTTDNNGIKQTGVRESSSTSNLKVPLGQTEKKRERTKSNRGNNTHRGNTNTPTSNWLSPTKPKGKSKNHSSKKSIAQNTSFGESI
jgi:hypothetical protein